MTGRAVDRSIFVVTNRDFRVASDISGYRLRDSLNRKGSREVRLFEATRLAGRDQRWRLDLIPDRPKRAVFDGLDAAEFLDDRKPMIRRGSDLVAARLFDRLRGSGRDLVLFIHGYNNTTEDALRRAHRLARRYDVEVLVFSWPANGGGSLGEDIHGVLSYKSDKSDARASVEALDRVLARMQSLIGELNAAAIDDVIQTVEARHDDASGEQRRRHLSERLQQRACPFKVTLLAHSMGNYLYKKMLMSSTERLSADMIFDNVILKAADANHDDHDEWIRRIRVRNRVYVLINSNDEALRLSTLKIGDLQRPRLGNTLAVQSAPMATYMDVSPHVGSAHSYFDRDDVDGAAVDALERFMGDALRGRAAAYGLPYFADTNTYHLQ